MFVMLHFFGVLQIILSLTRRSRIVENEKSKEDEVDSESSVHCMSSEERPYLRSSHLSRSSLKCIDILHSMMSSM